MHYGIYDLKHGLGSVTLQAWPTRAIQHSSRGILNNKIEKEENKEKWYMLIIVFINASVFLCIEITIIHYQCNSLRRFILMRFLYVHQNVQKHVCGF